MRKTRHREQAVALRYDQCKNSAPTVIAKGEGLIADKIKDIAAANGIPIHSDRDLVELLAQIDINHEIPSELYTAVAEILSWIYKANNALRRDQ
jgi:flagellar biosynthesis protein